MANIGFVRGLAKNLPSVATDGLFYLTTDTNRLYVGNSDNKLVDINRYVLVCTSTTLPASPASDDFIWMSDKNILAVCTNPNADGLNKWTQINPDTNTNDDTYVSGVKDTKVEVNDTTKDMTVSFTLTQTKKDIDGGTTAAADVPVSFTISADKFSQVETDVKVGLDAVTSDGAVKLTTTGSGADSGANALNLKGTGSTSITLDGDNITVSSTDTTYDLASSGTTVKGIISLSDSDGGSDNVDVVGGTSITVDGSTAGTITVKHSDNTVEQATKTGGNEIVGYGGTFNVVESIEANAQGHVTKVTTKTVEIPASDNTTYTATSISANENGDLSFTITDSDNTPSTATAEKSLYLTVNGDKVYNQGSIEFYTKAQVDEKFKTADALTYKGVVDNTTALPVANVKIGDVYKVNYAKNYTVSTGNEVAAKVGDLFIATGTETTDGVIAAGAVIWDLIPSGDDFDTQYTLGHSGTKITLSDNLGSETVDDEVEFSAGTQLSVTNTTNGIEYSHGTITTTPTTDTAAPAAQGTIDVVSTITTDNGHVTGYKTTTVTLPKDNNTTYTVANVTGENGYVGITDSDSGVQKVTPKAGDKMVVTIGNDTNNTITVAHDSQTTSTTPETATTLSHGGTFTAVTGYTSDGFGHITDVKTKEFTLPTDNDTTYTLSGTNTLSDDKKKFSHTSTLTDSDSGSSTSAFTVESDSLTMASTSTGISVDLVWGTF